jgi:hypothetical protein
MEKLRRILLTLCVLGSLYPSAQASIIQDQSDEWFQIYANSYVRGTSVLGVGQSFLMQEEPYQSIGIYIFPINRQYSYNTYLVATLYWATTGYIDTWYINPGTSFSGWLNFDVSSEWFIPNQTYTFFLSAGSPYWGAQASSSNPYPDGRAYTLYGTDQQDLRFRVTTNSPAPVPEPASCLLFASGLGLARFAKAKAQRSRN